MIELQPWMILSGFPVNPARLEAENEFSWNYSEEQNINRVKKFEISECWLSF